MAKKRKAPPHECKDEPRHLLFDGTKALTPEQMSQIRAWAEDLAVPALCDDPAAVLALVRARRALEAELATRPQKGRRGAPTRHDAAVAEFVAGRRALSSPDRGAPGAPHLPSGVRGPGELLRIVADRHGISADALWQAIYRARRAGKVSVHLPTRPRLNSRHDEV